MPFTNAQLQAIKTEINNDPALSSQPMNSDGAFAIAEALNRLDVPDFFVWRTDARVRDIFDAIDWAKYTPIDAVDATNASIYTARLLAIQTKQINLQNMLVGRDTIDTSRVNIRAGLRDAVIQLPSGAQGVATSAGGVSGVNVLNICVRKALRIERVLALASAPSDTTGTVTARIMGYEGQISYPDVELARAS